MSQQSPPEQKSYSELPPPPPAPPELPPPPQPELPAEGRRGCSGCAWGVAGALGCLVLLVVPIIGLLLMRTVTVNGIVGGIQSIFNAPVVITAQTVLDSIQGLSQLTTVRYNYSSLVTSERDMPDVLKLLYGEKQVLVAVGHVNAGIDLGQITADDITQDGSILIVRLPPPQLQDCFVNEQDSYIAALNTGLFSRSASELVIEGRRFAVRQFRDQALAEGILDAVQTQTQAVLQNLIATIAPNTPVRLVITPPDADAPPPESCQ
ncbi:MAG: DUF4230 domain-containing protein [Chloroflexi bacterium]|nr:DUF4230 domain-containing protein [Chloroflexota bacterium]